MFSCNCSNIFVHIKNNYEMLSLQERNSLGDNCKIGFSFVYILFNKKLERPELFLIDYYKYPKGLWIREN